MYMCLCIYDSHPGYFGKVGMRIFHLKRDTRFCPHISVDKLWALLPPGTFEQFAGKKDGTAPILDVTEHVCPAIEYPIVSNLLLGISQGSWNWQFSKCTHHCEGKEFLIQS